MKRFDLVRHLEAHGRRLLREGANHSVHLNPLGRKLSTLPGQRGINDFLAKKICRDLEIPAP